MDEVYVSWRLTSDYVPANFFFQRPLNSIGMPYFDSQLLSAWPRNLGSRVQSWPPPQKIPPQILATMKFNENIAYATLPKELRGRRNLANSEPRKGAGRFRSGKPAVDEVCFGSLFVALFTEIGTA